MDNNDVKNLVEAFRGYRDLLTPIQTSLSDFIDVYDRMKGDIEKLGSAFGGDVQGNLDKIYKTLSAQAAKATDLASQIDKFISMSSKYTDGINRMLGTFSKIEEKVAEFGELETQTQERLAKLDALIDEKKRSFNVRDLQRSVETYTENITKVGNVIDSGVLSVLKGNSEKLTNVKLAAEEMAIDIARESDNVETLVATYSETNALLKRVVERGEVNEEYLFDAFDRWATSRKVKIRK